jgi:hypothetical protein
MTGMASRLRGFSLLAALTLAALVATASAASAQQVEAKAEVISVVESGSFIDVQLRVSVTNGESSVASNVFVFFEDGLQIGLGDVAPRESAVSQTEKQSIDTSARPTQNYPLPVTVKFTFDGKDVEQKQTLYVRRPAAQGSVQ